jgi:hypothetical protein
LLRAARLRYGGAVQTGNLFKRHGAWFLRFYRDELVNGQPVRRRACVRLAPVNDDYRSRKDLQTEIDRHLLPVNRGSLPEGGLTFAQFYESHFLPHLEARNRKASTRRFYRDTFKVHLRDRVGHIRLRDFTTATAQGVLNSIDLSHQSLLRIKTCMSAAFTVARQLDFLREANPVVGAKAEGRRTHLRRAIWRTHVSDTKTDKSTGAVPVIAPLRRILDDHKRRAATDGYIFAGPKLGFALNLDNLTKREIRPVLGDRWHGWHAFRRGLTTNLYELGIPPEVSQIILRQEDVETTRRHYLMLDQQKHSARAMKRLEGAIRKSKLGQQMGNSKSKRAPRTSRLNRMDIG